MRTIGIDPGKTGAIALYADGDIAALHDMPMNGDTVDAPALYYLIGSMIHQRIFIERVELRPRQSGVINMVANYGIIMGIAELLTPGRVRQVSAQRWQSPLSLPKERKKKLAAYTAMAAQMWPWHEWYGPRGGLRDGRAAAALIARHGAEVSGQGDA